MQGALPSVWGPVLPRPHARRLCRPHLAEAGIPSPCVTSSETSPPQTWAFHRKCCVNRGPPWHTDGGELQSVFSGFWVKTGISLQVWIIPRSSLALSRFLKCLETQNSNIFLRKTCEHFLKTKKQNNSYFCPFLFKMTYPKKQKRKSLNQTLLKWRDSILSCFTKRTYVTLNYFFSHSIPMHCSGHWCSVKW